MAVGFPIQNQVTMMNMMLAGQGNSALAMRAGLQQAQCSYCQPDPSTGEHICGCVIVEVYYGGSTQHVLQQALNCDCPICPHAAHISGLGGFMNGGLQMGGAVSPFAAGYGMGGGLPMNAAIGMSAGLQMNPLAMQSMSPLSGAGFGGVAGFSGLGGLGGLGGLASGMMAPGFGANNSRMLNFPMGGGLANRHGFGRGSMGKLGYPAHRSYGRSLMN